jgi:hypothetical protein
MALNPNEFAYIIPWSAQFIDKNGKPLAAGFVEIYQAGTTGNKYISYKNWYGDRNAFRIPLDSIGKCVAIGDRNLHYDLYVYNWFGNLEYSRLNVVASNEYGGEVIHDNSLTGDGTADNPLSVVYDGLIRGIVGESSNVSTRIVSTASDGTKIYGISVREGGVAKYVTRENTLDEVKAIVEDGYWPVLLETDGGITQQFPLIFSNDIENGKFYFAAIPGNANPINASGDSVELSQWLLDSTGWTLTSLDIASKNYVDTQIGDLNLDNYEAYLYGKCNNQSLTASNLNQNLVTTKSLGNDIYISGGGINVKHGYYHVDVDVKIAGATIDANEYQVTLAGYGDSKSTFMYDNTYAHNDVIHYAFDIINDSESVISLPLVITHSIPNAKAYIESIQVFKPAPIVNGEGGGGGETYAAGDGIIINEYNVISVDYTKVQPKLVAGSGISIDQSTNTISVTGSFSQVQSDWDETDTSDPSYIKNKPDLDQYAKTADLAPVALSNDYTDLNNRPSIPVVNDGTLTIQKNGTTIDTFSANSSSNKTVNIAVPTKTSDITNDSGFITANDIPAQVNADWNASSGVAEILNKPNLATVATSGSYSDLTGTPTFVAGQNIVITESGSIITISATTSADTVFVEYGSNTYTNKQIRDMLKAGKLVIVYRTYGYYTTYAKPTYMYDIAQDTGDVCFSAVEHPSGNADGHLVRLVQYFSNANGWSNNDYDLSQADWNATSGAAKILNKPNLATVATSGSYNDLTDTPSIPSGEELVPAHSSSDNGKVLGVNSSGNTEWVNAGGGGTQVQSNWTETDTTDPSYIQNKPGKTFLVAGNNISIVEDLQNSTITISATSSLTYINVTPSSGTIALDATTHQSAFLMSSAEVTAITNQDGNMNSVVIQWTSTSSTTLPTVPNTWHAASANPASLTVGKTYQLRLLGTCYSIVEFA